MIKSLLGIITSPLAGPVGAAAALLLLALALTQCSEKAVQSHRAAVAEKKLESSQRDLRTCQGNERDLKGSIASQNAALETLRSEATVRTAAAEKAVSDALKGRASAEARAAKLLAQPPAGIDACARAMSAFKTVKENLR